MISFDFLAARFHIPSRTLQAMLGPLSSTEVIHHAGYLIQLRRVRGERPDQGLEKADAAVTSCLAVCSHVAPVSQQGLCVGASFGE